MIAEAEVTNIHLDDKVDEEIESYVNPDAPRSFFLFAGAGSGKTRSLVKALNFIREAYAQRLALHGQRVGVITYTKAARDEIIRRIESDSTFYVATIHSFAWELIQGFNHDIREWLRVDLERDIVKLKADEAKGRPGTRASTDRITQIESKTKRLSQLDAIRTFVYSPDGLNRERNSLNHSDIISIASNFLLNKPTMQWILVGRFPLLFIDESQDTNKHLVEAFFVTAKEHEDRFGLGLIGDVMQRIYPDGKDGIDRGLPASWATPTKKLNHRCPKRIVKIINKIRSECDSHTQVPRSDAIEGHVRLFVRSTSANRKSSEDAVREQMADITADEAWRDQGLCKILTLEHHMAAARLGFAQLLEPLLSVNSWRTSVLDGTFPVARFISKAVLPLVVAARAEDRFSVAKLVRTQSPLLSVDALMGGNSQVAMREANAAVKALAELWSAGEPTCGDVLDVVSRTGLLQLPDSALPAVKLRAAQDTAASEIETADELTEETTAILKFLDAPFSQVSLYADYVAGLASFDTHQGVKGLEFDRVMVLMDDAEARGFMFGYEKLFGAKALSETDHRNSREGKETGLDRTRRLFYVTCSRAERSLALVIYTDDPLAVKAHVLANGWFAEAEIDVRP